MVTTSFGNRTFMQPIGSLSMHSKCLDFFLLSFGWEGWEAFVPKCSLQVPNMFPRFLMCSSMVLPIAPRFNPLCFSQSPPLLTYIGVPKGEVLHLSIESSILGSLHSFNFSFAKKLDL